MEAETPRKFRATWHRECKSIEGAIFIVNRQLHFEAAEESQPNLKWSEYVLLAEAQDSKIHLKNSVSPSEGYLETEADFWRELSAKLDIEKKGKLVSFIGDYPFLAFLIGLLLYLVTVNGVVFILQQNAALLGRYISLEKQEKIGKEYFDKYLAQKVLVLPPPAAVAFNQMINPLKEVLTTSGLRSFFKKLEKQSQHSVASKSLEKWLSDHPLTADRITLLPQEKGSNERQSSGRTDFAAFKEAVQ